MRTINSALRWLLPASIALNVFFLTIFCLHEWGHRHHPPRPGQMVDEMAQGLSSADETILREAFSTRTPLIDKAFASMRRVPEHVHMALGAQEFDADALQRAFAENRVAHQTIEDALSAAITEAAKGMSLEGRRRLALWPPHFGGPPPPPPGADFFGGPPPPPR